MGLLGLALGAAAGFYYRGRIGKDRVDDLEARAEAALENAGKTADQIVLSAKDRALEIREAAEEELENLRKGLRREESGLQRRRENLDKRVERIEKREQSLSKRQSALDRQRNEIAKLEEERMAILQRLSEMSKQEAKEELIGRVEADARQDMARTIRQVEAEAKEEADERARHIITTAIQRVASEQVAELTVSTVPLTNDNMKGRIIGRGGRNIRAFEKVAGVDVVVDDTPEAVTVSSFDPVRREVAARAMARLVVDGRIHPSRIEKVVADCRKEVDRIIREEGERAAVEVGIHGLHPEILKLIGRLSFRTSYGQNQHAHAIETAKLAGLLAQELGANARLARMAGLLHDIGKAVDFEVEGTHAGIGADILRRYKIPEEVIHAVAAHHHEVEQNSIEAVIVEAADAISGARPGARRESLELYLKRIHALEEVAHSFKGVQEAYAIQAGREIRVVVKPEQIDDLATIRLSKDIASRVEDTMEYPGQIKVTVIREMRAEELAR
jgi:ribonuclease Y